MIVSYYENIYKKSDSDDINFDNCIVDFLGEEIASHPLVVNSKLTADEKTSLDSPLLLRNWILQ
jgi:hypothetical protein